MDSMSDTENFHWTISKFPNKVLQRRRVKVFQKRVTSLVYLFLCVLFVFQQISPGNTLCVWQGGGGFRLACGFRQSGLFRLRSLGGLKGWAGAGFTIGDEDGFKDSLTNAESKDQVRNRPQLQQQYGGGPAQRHGEYGVPGVVKPNVNVNAHQNVPQVFGQYSNVNVQQQQSPQTSGSHKPGGLQKRASLWNNWKWPSILSKKQGPRGPGPGQGQQIRPYPPPNRSPSHWNPPQPPQHGYPSVARGPHLRNIPMAQSVHNQLPPQMYPHNQSPPQMYPYQPYPPQGMPGDYPVASQYPIGPNPIQPNRNNRIPDFSPMPELEPLEEESDPIQETQIRPQESFQKRKKPYGLQLLENSVNYGTKFQISPSSSPEEVNEDSSVVTGYDTNLFPDIYFTSTTPKDKLKKQLQMQLEQESTTEAILRKLKLKKIKLLKKGHKLKVEKPPKKQPAPTTTERRIPPTTTERRTPPTTTERRTPPTTTTETTTTAPTTTPTTTTTTTTTTPATTTTTTTSERPMPPNPRLPYPPDRPDYGENIYYNPRTRTTLPRFNPYAIEVSTATAINRFVNDWAQFNPSTTPSSVRDYSSLASNPLIMSGKWKEIYDPRFPPDHPTNRGKLELLAAALTTTSERPFYMRNDYFNPASHFDRSSSPDPYERMPGESGIRTKITIDGGDDGQFVKFDSREAHNLVNRTRSYNDAFYTHFNKSAMAISMQPSPTPYDYFNAFHNNIKKTTTTEYPENPPEISWLWERKPSFDPYAYAKKEPYVRHDYYGGDDRSSERKREHFDISPNPPTIVRWAGLGQQHDQDRNSAEYRRPSDLDSIESVNQALRRKALSLVGSWEPASLWDRNLGQPPAADFVTNDNFKYPSHLEYPPYEPPTTTTTTTPRPTTTTTTTTTPRPTVRPVTERPQFMYSSTPSYNEWKDYVQAVTGRSVGSSTTTQTTTTRSPSPLPVIVNRESEVSHQPHMMTRFREEEARRRDEQVAKQAQVKPSESSVKVSVAGESESFKSTTEVPQVQNSKLAALEKEIEELKLRTETRETLMKDILFRSKEVQEYGNTPTNADDESEEKDTELSSTTPGKPQRKPTKAVLKKKYKKKPAGEAFLPVSGPSEAPLKPVTPPPSRMFPPPPPPTPDSFINRNLPNQRLGPPPPPSDFATHHLNDFENTQIQAVDIQTDWNLHPLPSKDPPARAEAPPAPPVEQVEQIESSNDNIQYHTEPLQQKKLRIPSLPNLLGRHPPPVQYPVPASYPSPTQGYNKPIRHMVPGSHPSPNRGNMPLRPPHPSQGPPLLGFGPLPSGVYPFPPYPTGMYPNPSGGPPPSSQNRNGVSPSPSMMSPSEVSNMFQHPSGMPPPQQYPSGMPSLQQHPSSMPSLHPHPSGMPPPHQYPSGMPSLQQHPSGMPPPQQYPSGMPPPQQYPSGMPPPQQYPSGMPSLQQHPSGMPPPQQYPSDMPSLQQHPSGMPPQQQFTTGRPPRIYHHSVNRNDDFPNPSRRPTSSPLNIMSPPPMPPSQITRKTKIRTTSTTEPSTPEPEPETDDEPPIPETPKPSPPPLPPKKFQPLNEKESILRALQTLSEAKSHMIHSVVSESFGGQVPGLVKVVPELPAYLTSTTTTTTTTTPRPMTPTEQTRFLLNDMPDKYAPLLSYMKSLKTPHYENDKVQIDYFNFKSAEEQNQYRKTQAAAAVSRNSPSVVNLSIEDLALLASSAPDTPASQELETAGGEIDPEMSKFEAMLTEALGSQKKARPDPPTTPEPPPTPVVTAAPIQSTPTPLVRTLTQMGIIQRLHDRNVSSTQLDMLRKIIALNKLEQGLNNHNNHTPQSNHLHRILEITPTPTPSTPAPTPPPPKPTIPTAQLLSNFEHILKHMTTPSASTMRSIEMNSIQPSPSMMSLVGHRMSLFDPSRPVGNSHYQKQAVPTNPAPPPTALSALKTNLNLNNPTLQALKALALHRIQNIQPSPNIQLPQQTAPAEEEEPSPPDYEPLTVDLSPIFGLSHQESEPPAPIDIWKTKKRAVQVRNAPKSYYPGDTPLSFDTSSRDIYTDFQCEDQEFFPGLYADPENSCKVFHLCAKTNSGFLMKTFRCPQETVFDQEVLRCNWGLYVDCAGVQDKYNFNKYLSQSFQFLKTLGEFSAGYKVANNGSLVG